VVAGACPHDVLQMMGFRARQPDVVAGDRRFDPGKTTVRAAIEKALLAWRQGVPLLCSAGARFSRAVP